MKAATEGQTSKTDYWQGRTQCITCRNSSLLLQPTERHGQLHMSLCLGVPCPLDQPRLVLAFLLPLWDRISRDFCSPAHSGNKNQSSSCPSFSATVKSADSLLLHPTAECQKKITEEPTNSRNIKCPRQVWSHRCTAPSSPLLLPNKSGLISKI